MFVSFLKSAWRNIKRHPGFSLINAGGLYNYEFRISLRWWFFAAAGMITILIATIAVSYQAIKAAMVNPVRSLRSE